MANTMNDLRIEVVSRMRDTLHDEEVEMLAGAGGPHVPHMLGITGLREIHDRSNEEMTILDPSHPFWKEWSGDGSVDTRNGIMRQVEAAITSLEEDGLLRVSYPYGEERDIVYVEVEDIDE